MLRSNKYYRGIISLALITAWQGNAFASFLDTDFWCRTYGCAVVHDGQNFDIYDNYIFAQNRCCIPVGTAMIPFSSRFGTFNLTGTLSTHQGPNNNQGMMIGITQNGSTISQSINDDGDGYLDAADTLNAAFVINPNTDIRLDGPGRQYSHSFFITSRNTHFSMRARSSITNSTLDFASTLGLDDIQIEPRVSAFGNDAGYRYGRRARTSQINISPGINDLGDLQGAPTRLISFNRNAGIRRRNGNINDQTIRLDFIYTMPQYDLSMGIGSMDIAMVFDFYREP
jgi:hypothetical protein